MKVMSNNNKFLDLNTMHALCNRMLFIIWKLGSSDENFLVLFLQFNFYCIGISDNDLTYKKFTSRSYTSSSPRDITFTIKNTICDKMIWYLQHALNSSKQTLDFLNHQHYLPECILKSYNFKKTSVLICNASLVIILCHQMTYGKEAPPAIY
ncbi:hypothetical protein Tsp_06461 [Trichinella spiralis]|uniref:hypothetical protein n=1 Tax=Trichinella spiralis TaxID=6334 RepID=UPI0001EFC6D0|nr:hypothetical protein Tsp_06461 [Trichinella spiralis]